MDRLARQTTPVRWLALLVVVFVGLPGVAAADEDADIVLLLTQVVEGEDDQEIRFWWSEADKPRWTESDEVVFASLRELGVQPAMPDAINISRIYRRPGLSTDNAAQLGRLLNSERVLVGEVQYRSLPPVAPLGMAGVQARAVVELVPAGDAEGISLERFTVQRTVFGDDVEDLMARAQQMTGRALGEVIGQSLQRVSGDVGSQSGNRLLALRNLERAENLEKIRDRLVEIEEVDRVVERWASEGVIALEVAMHGEAASNSGMLDYVFRALENHEFEDFHLIRNEPSSLHNVTEFWLEPRRSQF